MVFESHIPGSNHVQGLSSVIHHDLGRPASWLRRCVWVNIKCDAFAAIICHRRTQCAEQLRSRLRWCYRNGYVENHGKKVKIHRFSCPLVWLRRVKFPPRDGNASQDLGIAHYICFHWAPIFNFLIEFVWRWFRREASSCKSFSPEPVAAQFELQTFCSPFSFHSKTIVPFRLISELASFNSSCTGPKTFAILYGFHTNTECLLKASWRMRQISGAQNHQMHLSESWVQ